jgi:hypothetical protein
MDSVRINAHFPNNAMGFDGMLCVCGMTARGHCCPKDVKVVEAKMEELRELCMRVEPLLAHNKEYEKLCVKYENCEYCNLRREMREAAGIV